MDWKTQMKEAMVKMTEACHANSAWTECAECPFDEYCTALMDAGLVDAFEGLKLSSDKVSKTEK